MNLSRQKIASVAFTVIGIAAVVATVMHALHPVAGMVLASAGLGRPILTAADLAAHQNNLGNVQDVVWAPLYDANSWGTAGQLQISYFSSPVGQGTTSAPGATGVKTISDTNMQAAGVLPKGNDFFLTGLEFVFFPGSNPEQDLTAAGINGQVNDTYLAMKSGLVTFTVGSLRIYVQDGPLVLFPPSAGLYVAAAIGGNDTAATNALLTVAYARAAGAPYELTPIYIEATQGFQETVTWPAVVALATTARMFSRMNGYLIRNAQ